LGVVDRYADGAASTEGRLLGLATLFRSDNADTVRSAAGRAALESVVFAPHCCLPEREVQWRAERDDLILATFDLAPERPEVRVRIDHRGAMRAAIAGRWGPAGGKRFDYIPCGAEIHAERRFGDLVLPASLSVGWWFDTPRYAPFFEAEIVSVAASP
jgi:hypothetical protein